MGHLLASSHNNLTRSVVSSSVSVFPSAISVGVLNMDTVLGGHGGDEALSTFCSNLLTISIQVVRLEVGGELSERSSGEGIGAGVGAIVRVSRRERHESLKDSSFIFLSRLIPGTVINGLSIVGDVVALFIGKSEMLLGLAPDVLVHLALGTSGTSSTRGRISKLLDSSETFRDVVAHLFFTGFPESCDDVVGRWSSVEGSHPLP